MKKQAFLFLLALGASSAWAQQATVSGPDSQLKVDVSVDGGTPFYSITYKGKTMLEKSPLGFVERRRLQPRHDLHGTKDPEH